MDDDADKSQTVNEFKEKLKTISFGTVPGAYKDSNRYDEDSLKSMDWPSKEEVMDHRSDYKNAPEKEVKLEGQPEYKH
jgi:hypothetical protein